MILTVMRCQTCNNEFRFNPQQHPSTWDIPSDWFTVFQGKDFHAQEGWHFCSKDCLNLWTKPAQEDKPEAIQHEPHPYCCQFHYPLSLRKYNEESKS